MTAPGEGPPVTTTIHARGAARLDAVVDLVAYASRPRPLATSLDELPRRIAAVFASEVCSIYVLEGHDLVMRGNVGFTPNALGEVRLAVGEGLTGMAVECMRPISADTAPDHARYRHFPGLGEEHYPAFLAVPIPGPIGATGAVVVQRRGDAYATADVELLAALAGAVSPQVERARIVDSIMPPPPAPSGTRRVTLAGRALVPGRALGLVAAVRRPGRGPADPVRPRKEAARALEKAIFACDASLEAFARAAARRGLDGAFLEMHRTILADGRLRERALEIAASQGLGHALAQVAREATRTAREVDDATLDERAQELSELCDALRLLAASGDPAEIPRDAVWIADHLTVYDLVVAMRSRPAAVVLGGKVEAGRPRVLVDLLGVPAVADLPGVLRWASEGDVALVDGDHGLVRLNPTRRERDEARAERKE